MDPLRKHLVELLQGGQAHLSFEDAVKGFPVDKAGVQPQGSPHSAWELLEHIRVALHDIVVFSRANSDGEEYVELKWPEDYWPPSPAPDGAEDWRRSVSMIEQDLKVFTHYIQDPKHDLVKPFSWGSGQTLLREAMLIADHNAYHVGQLVLLRRMIE